MTVFLLCLPALLAVLTCTFYSWCCVSSSTLAASLMSVYSFSQWGLHVVKLKFSQQNYNTFPSSDFPYFLTDFLEGGGFGIQKNINFLKNAGNSFLYGNNLQCLVYQTFSKVFWDILKWILLCSPKESNIVSGVRETYDILMIISVVLLNQGHDKVEHQSLDLIIATRSSRLPYVILVAWEQISLFS